MAKVTFVGSDGTETICEGNDGMTLMEVAIKNSVHGIDADCGGACACATCHVYVREDWKDATGEREEMESDMLDFAFEVKDNSRLSCQIKISDALDGSDCRCAGKTVLIFSNAYQKRHIHRQLNFQ